MIPLHLLLAALFGWLEREPRDVIEFLREENRVLKRQLCGRRLRLCDDERRRLAVLGARLGHRVLAEVVSLVTPETILRWHRELIGANGRTDHPAIVRGVDFNAVETLEMGSEGRQGVNRRRGP